MASYIFDIDGTLVYYHTNKWLPGALDYLKSLNEQGHKILLITMRSSKDDGTEWSINNTKKLFEDLESLGIDFKFVSGMDSPR